MNEPRKKISRLFKACALSLTLVTMGVSSAFAAGCMGTGINGELIPIAPEKCMRQDYQRQNYGQSQNTHFEASPRECWSLGILHACKGGIDGNPNTLPSFGSYPVNIRVRSDEFSVRGGPGPSHGKVFRNPFNNNDW